MLAEVRRQQGRRAKSEERTSPAKLATPGTEFLAKCSRDGRIHSDRALVEPKRQNGFPQGFSDVRSQYSSKGFQGAAFINYTTDSGCKLYLSSLLVYRVLGCGDRS